MEEQERKPTLRWSEEVEGTPKASRRKSHGPDDSKLTEEALLEAALRYLDKQDASLEQVRLVLGRRHARYGTDDNHALFEERVTVILVRLKESRILDDERFAKGLAESLRRKGGSTPLIRQKLAQRGLSEAHVDLGLDSLALDSELSEEASASTYARKRKLQEKYDLEDPKERQKALAVLGRQGFSYEVACAALGVDV